MLHEMIFLIEDFENKIYKNLYIDMVHRISVVILELNYSASIT